MVALTLLALAGAGVGGALAPQQDALALNAEDATTTAGNTATITVSVTNTGNETVGGNYLLAANASALPAGSKTNISNATVVRGPLNESETKTTTVSVTVPENASIGDYQLSLALSSGDKTWANTTATVRVAEASTITTNSGSNDRGDNSEDRAMGTTAENISGGGGAVPVVVADEPSGPVEQLLELATTPLGFVAIVVLLAFGFVSVRSRHD